MSGVGDTRNRRNNSTPTFSWYGPVIFASKPLKTPVTEGTIPHLHFHRYGGASFASKPPGHLMSGVRDTRNRRNNYHSTVLRFLQANLQDIFCPVSETTEPKETNPLS